MISLCPDCRAPLAAGVYRCAQCFLGFKDEATMVRRSLWIPGGGYFYTGNLFLGVMDSIAEGYLLLLVLTFLLVGLGVLSADLIAEPGEDPLEPAAAFFSAGFLMVLLVIEKWMTIHHCRRLVREFIPAK